MVAYLEGLSREGMRGVVFLDNAPFHRSRGFQEAVTEAFERLQERMGQEVLQSLCVGT
ncbi:hypothetical protein Mhypo_03097 [Meiothermus hypogaeus]|uniref:Tc1-like transposase DDE domain-containing protein n=1 Tax=Meiothermus hypogaeus TaxID=884155 RepID=A0ABX9MJ78_9DEIN|nr:hypothetical protein Mhypo_03097 [Meiothermus hypogaeus]